MADVTQISTTVIEEGEFPQRRFKFFVLFFLYVASFVPTFFFPIVFPVMLRQSGAPLSRIGLFGIFTIPMVLKFLWAPYVDAYGHNKFGHYKTWLIASQLFCAGIGSIIAFLNFSDQFWWIMGFGVLYVTSISTQWIATNGLAVRCLNESERPRGNSLATMGMAIGTVAGGSMVMLVGQIGYTTTMLLTLSLLIIASIMLLFFKEPRTSVVPTKVNLLSSFKTLKSKPLRRWLLLINLCVIGDSMINTMLRPLLVDRGLSIDSIGFLLGTIRPFFGTIGAAVCPPILKILTQKLNLVVFGLINTIAVGLFLLPALNLTSINSLYIICAVVGLSNSFKWTLIYSIFMDFSRKEYAATDFAVQVSMLSIGISFYDILSGVIASSFGYAHLFILSIVLDIIGILLVGFFFQGAKAHAKIKTESTAAAFSEA